MMDNIYDTLAKEVDKVSEEREEPKKRKTEEIIEDSSAAAEEPTGPAQTMADFLNQTKISFPKEGDVIEGKVLEIGSNAIYLDLGVFGTGIVLGKEIKDGLGTTDKLKIGDLVSATVTDIENENGYIELSVREASIEKAWLDLEEKQAAEEVFAVKILDANKGGLIVEVNGITGFLPVSQLSNEHYPRVEEGEKIENS